MSQITINLRQLSANSLSRLATILREEENERFHLASAVPEEYDGGLCRVASEFNQLAASVERVRNEKIEEQRLSRERMNAALAMVRERREASANAIAEAVSRGAKFHQRNDGRWVLLDVPRDSSLWTLSFATKERAARAFTIVARRRHLSPA